MTRVRVVLSCAFCALMLAVCAQGARAADPPAPAPTPVYIKAGHLFDATSDHLRDNVIW